MFSGRQLRGLTVYAQQDKKLLGRVSDVVADPVTGIIQGLMISSASLASRRRYLPAHRISAISLSGVTVGGPEALEKAGAWEGGLWLSRLPGRRLRDGQGAELGVVADYLCDQQRLRGLELSQGLAADIRHGRDYVDWRDMEDNYTLS